MSTHYKRKNLFLRNLPVDFFLKLFIIEAENNTGSLAEGIISADPGTPLLKNNRERLPVTKLLGDSKGFCFINKKKLYQARSSSGFFQRIVYNIIRRLILIFHTC